MSGQDGWGNRPGRDEGAIGLDVDRPAHIFLALEGVEHPRTSKELSEESSRPGASALQRRISAG